MRKHLLLSAGVIAAALLLPPRARAQASEGAALYQKSCVVCHGESGKGDGPAGKALTPRPPDLSDAKRMGQITDAKLTEVIMKGSSKGMPAYGHILKPSEVQELVAYIRSLSRKPPQ